MAFPPNAFIGDDILSGATDILQLFGLVAEIIRELQNRFDELPILHSLVNYQSYYQGELQRLIGDPYGHPTHEVASLREFVPMTRQAYRWNGLDE